MWRREAAPWGRAIIEAIEYGLRARGSRRDNKSRLDGYAIHFAGLDSSPDFLYNHWHFVVQKTIAENGFYANLGSVLAHILPRRHRVVNEILVSHWSASQLVHK